MIFDFLRRKGKQLAKAEMSFFDHIDALRGHLFRSVLAIFILSIVFFSNKHFLFDVIVLGPKSPHFITYQWFCWLGEKLNMDSLCISSIDYKLRFQNMSSTFFIHLKVAFVMGVIFAFPYILWEIWRFVAPALYNKEKRNFTGVVFMGSFLFYLGCAFGYLLIAPFSLNFLGTYQLSDQVQNDFSFDSYLDIMTGLVFWTGLIFEIPMIAYFLAKLGILTTAFMHKSRKYAIVISLILAAIITPSADMFSQTLVALPLWLLYEFSILVVWRQERKKRRAES